jgi:hypothetical protein
VISQAYVTSGKGFSPYGENKVYPEIQFQPQTQKNPILDFRFAILDGTAESPHEFAPKSPKIGYGVHTNRLMGYPTATGPLNPPRLGDFERIEFSQNWRGGGV